MYDHATNPRLGQKAPMENPGIPVLLESDAPEAPYSGQLTYFYDLGALRVFDGSAWVDVGGSGGGTSRNPSGVDVRNYGSSTSGVFGTGDADKDTACILEGIADLTGSIDGELGGPPLLIPTNLMHLAAPIVRTSPVPVHGAAMGGTVIKVTEDMDGEWAWTDDDMNRNGAWAMTADEIDSSLYKGYADIRDITLAGNRTFSGRFHGYRTTNSNDDLRQERFHVCFFNGVGYRLGDPAPSGGFGGTVRESSFIDVRVMGCGDAANGFDAWQITQADSVSVGADGTNQLTFINPWFVTNRGRGYIGTGSADEVMRRITFVSMMLHGAPGSAVDDDLLCIEGRISGLAILGMRTNSAEAGNACIRWKEKNGFVPGLQQVTGFNVSATAGSAFAIDDVGALILEGTTGPGDIDEWEVIVADESTANPGTPAVGSGRFSIVTASASRKVSIPPNSAENISFEWGRQLRKAPSTTQLNNTSDLVNIVDKYKGKMVFSSTMGQPLWATGADPGDPWVEANGTGGRETTGSINSFVPTGALTAYAGASAPTGWRLCDGTSLLRTTYSDLFDVVGTTYGSVDSTHFNLPDLRSRSPVGSGTGSTLAANDGVAESSRAARRAHAHIHTAAAVTLTTAANPAGAGTTRVSQGSHTHTIASGDSGDHAYLVINYIIKV